MKTTLTKWWGVILIFIFLPIYFHFSQAEGWAITLSNYFFLAALVCFGCVAFISVLRSGSFDLLQKSFKRLRILKQHNEPNEIVPWSEIFGQRPMRFLLTGVASFLVSLCFLLFR